jgi:hypothetical protein
MDTWRNPLVLRVALFLVVLLLIWAIAGFLLGSAVAGFFIGLIAATFATGAATLNVRRDGSWTLRRR